MLIKKHLSPVAGWGKRNAPPYFFPYGKIQIRFSQLFLMPRVPSFEATSDYSQRGLGWWTGGRLRNNFKWYPLFLVTYDWKDLWKRRIFAHTACPPKPFSLKVLGGQSLRQTLVPQFISRRWKTFKRRLWQHLKGLCILFFSIREKVKGGGITFAFL